MGFELFEAGGDIPALLAPVDARHKQVDEPHEAVLVHRLYVGQVRDAEEEDLARVGDRRVAPADLLFSDGNRADEQAAKRETAWAARYGVSLLFPTASVASRESSETSCL